MGEKIHVLAITQSARDELIQASRRNSTGVENNLYTRELAKNFKFGWWPNKCNVQIFIFVQLPFVFITDRN